MHYTLPCDPGIRRLDRFDLLESEDVDDSGVPFWELLEAILTRPRASSGSELIEQLETIAVTLRGTTGTCDYGVLRDFIDSYTGGGGGRSRAGEGGFFENAWPGLVQLALEMPVLFGKCSLPVLSMAQREVVLSRRQVACLVVHQFLGSLLSQPWETDSSPDFSIWYSSSGVVHTGAVETYLTALFTYFDRVCVRLDGGGDDGSDHPIRFSLHVSPDGLRSELEERPLRPMTVSCRGSATTAPNYLGLPNGACVISANKNIGFGRTGTQEERHVGCSPESCPVVLLAPTLGDMEVVVVRGPEATVSVQGHGRDACLDQVLAGRQEEHEHYEWADRTMLFMDALELDVFDAQGGVPDLLPGHVDRELRKAYLAFSSNRYSRVFTGLWGCGAFGGNREIKTLIQWCAASMAGVTLQFECAGPDQRDFALDLADVSREGIQYGWSVRGVLDLLRKMQPDDPRARNVFALLDQS